MNKHGSYNKITDRKNFKNCEKGAIAVEFALITPVFIMILLGFIQFGAVMFIQNNMMNVARDTSRRAATGDLSKTQAEAFALNQLVNWNISYTVAVTLPNPADPNAWDVTASVSAPMADAALFDYLGILAGRTLNASATMRREY